MTNQTMTVKYRCACKHIVEKTVPISNDVYAPYTCDVCGMTIAVFHMPVCTALSVEPPVSDMYLYTHNAVQWYTEYTGRTESEMSDRELATAITLYTDYLEETENAE